MAKQTRSVVFALKQETTEGTLVQPAAATDFTALRQGYKFDSGVSTVATNELINNIGKTQTFVAKQNPSGSIAKYFKHSGTEGTAPDYGELIKCAMGQVITAGTEYNTSTSSTAGSATAAPVLNMASGAGSHFVKGQAVLIKDGTNGYAIRNITSISTDALTLNYNLAAAPATALGTGKAVHYAALVTGHPTFSAHLYQATSSAAFHQAISGCRTTSMNMNFPANALAEITFAFEGLAAYYNPFVVTSSNCSIDGDIGGTTNGLTATLTQQTYNDPQALATEVQNKMVAAGFTAVTCTWSNATGKFTIAKPSGTLNIGWNTGSNTATSAAALLGFSTAADSTGALTYTSPTAASYDPSYTPSYDTSTANVVRNNELHIGGFARNDLRKGSKVQFTVATPRSEVKDVTAVNGISESIVLERTVTMTCSLILQPHEVQEFDTMINNGTVQVMFNHGQKSGANWVAGTCVNIFLPQATITKNVLADDNGVQIVDIEAKGYVTGSADDIHINLL